MIKRFLVLCICVCCIISVFALPHRWNYDGLQTALHNVTDESGAVRDDFATIALLSYYWEDRLVVDYDNENIVIRKEFGVVGDPSAPDDILYGINYSYQIVYSDDPPIFEDYRNETFYFSDEAARDRAFRTLTMVFDNSRTLDGAPDESTVIGEIAHGIIFVYHTLMFLVAIAMTFVYFFFDIIGVGLILIKEMFWLLGFI